MDTQETVDRLRDYFAANALIGLLAQESEYSWSDKAKRAQHAYEIADSMLKAREVKP